MARPSDYRAGYRENTRNRQKKENKFYTKVNNGGILNKRLPGIDEIKQNIEAEKRRAQEYENEWLDSVVNNADERQTEAAKARAQEAKSSVKNWNEKLSEAYGLGDDGYWNRGTQKSITQQSEQMREHPEHAYGIGQYSPAAEQPKPAAIPGAAGSAKGRQIMQLQDTLVHNPGMSDAEKSTLQEKINNLTAEKEVLDWKDANPGTPTVENYEAQKGYYDRLWQQNQDAIVNGLGNGTLKQGSDEWYELFKKGDDLLAMKDAYNRGMMGLMDGDKAKTAEEQVTAGGEQGQEGIIKPYPWLPDEKDETSEDTIKPYPWSPGNEENGYLEPESNDALIDTSGVKLTYNVVPLTNSENEDATLHGEVTNSKVIETKEEVNEIFSNIINGRYDGFNGLGFIEKITDLTPLGFIDMEEIPKRARGYDAFGRPVYIEVGYEIVTVDRTFSIDEQMLCETEYFVYDNEGKEVLHDCYIEILKNF